MGEKIVSGYWGVEPYGPQGVSELNTEDARKGLGYPCLWFGFAAKPANNASPGEFLGSE